MTSGEPATWRVGPERQAAFADLSGDHNPLHVDPIAARRLPFGRVAVHGVHLLLDALDRIVAATDRAPHRIRCTFRHSVGIDDEITTSIDLSGATDATATVTVDVWTAADIRVELGGPLAEVEIAVPPLTRVGGPEVHTIDDLAGSSGTIPVGADTAAATALFPQLSGCIGTARLAELISLTRLVGMHVPGLRSLLSGLDVTLVDEIDRRSDGLRHTVVVADERFSRVVIDVAGPATTGTLTTFLRPEPIVQTLGGTRARPNEFEGRRWLVVGGSRGLGAMLVLLLASGDADVRFTYVRGEADAADVARLTGASAYRLDVLDVGEGLTTIMADGWRPTHLAYMATPPIFDGVGGTYSDNLYERLHGVYVDAFLELVERLDPLRLTGIVWPSSDAAGHDIAGLAEYADAKRAGERACRDLAAANPHLVVHRPRLPRLLTDQSTSFVPTEFGDAAAELLQALHDVAG